MDAAANRSNKKPRKKNQIPEAKFRLELELCSKRKDLNGAISLYETAVQQNLKLNLYLFNALLFLCSSSVSNPELKASAIEFGFRVYENLKSDGVVPNEAAITSAARLAAAKGDGEMAFELVKEIGGLGFVPKLRSYDPALLFFCENLEAEKAYEVEEHMRVVDVGLEEMEIGALLKVSSRVGNGGKVYEYLHKLRKVVRSVSLETASVIEEWFAGEVAVGVESSGCGESEVKEAILMNGGGFHGLGWIGEGSWTVSRKSIGVDGQCSGCGEKLVCVDIDGVETEKFASSLASLAIERETKANFRQFMDWLDDHAHYDAIVDGANVALYQQNFADGGFSIAQLEAIVKELCNKKHNKRPLVILHNKRLRAFMENPSSRKLLEEWTSQDILYATPHGSNDDWYLLYAAVKLKGLVVTNDELRDHIFELLGRSFIIQWKERHQVRYTFPKGSLRLQMPPPYSTVIQESEKGTWHVPVARSESNDESITWLCITRSAPVNGFLAEAAVAKTGLNAESKDITLHSCNSNNVSRNTGSVSGNRTLSSGLKRKHRSPSPQLQTLSP